MELVDLEIPRPKVFISYSHDDEHHKRWVRRLAEALERCGVHVVLDQWELRPGTEITYFMDEGLTRSDFVLVICTPSYALRAGARSKGVGYESRILAARVLSGATSSDVIVPAIRSGRDDEVLPEFVRGKAYVDFRRDAAFEEKVGDLVVRFHDRFVYSRPMARKKKPSYPATLGAHQLAAMANAKAEWSDKLPLYERALALEESPALHRKAAFCALHLNDFQAAYDHDSLALDLSPDYSPSWSGLVVAASFLGRFDVLQKAFREVQKRIPEANFAYLEAAFYYGEHLFRTGRRKEGGELLRKVVESDKSSPYFDALRLRAQLYLASLQR